MWNCLLLLGLWAAVASVQGKQFMLYYGRDFSYTLTRAVEGIAHTFHEF